MSYEKTLLKLYLFGIIDKILRNEKLDNCYFLLFISNFENEFSF